MTWLLLLFLLVVPVLWAFNPSINWRITTYDAVGTTVVTVVNSSSATNVPANYIDVDMTWTALLALNYVSATTQVAPITRIKVEAQNVVGLPLNNATAQAYWGLIKGP